MLILLVEFTTNYVDADQCISTFQKLCFINCTTNLYKIILNLIFQIVYFSKTCWTFNVFDGGTGYTIQVLFYQDLGWFKTETYLQSTEIQ